MPQPNRFGPLYGAAGSLGALLLLMIFIVQAPEVLAGGRLHWKLEWAPSLGIGFGLMLDGLSLIFALLISGIGALIFLYSIGYMGGHPQFGRFVLILFGFMLSMLGLVLAQDLITLFVFWELTSLTSYLLIGFEHRDARARRNALQSLLITGAGGLALLAALVLIGMASGTQDIAAILGGEGLQNHALYTPILLLLLLGAFTKSAQLPFHVWLPNAMAAPTPVSAYLHSATMVKAGIYLLARFHPVLGGTLSWALLLGAAGLATAVFASVQALRQSDLKQALAWTTLMALGTLTLMLAGSSPYALTAALTFLVVHALYKAALFMVVGAIDHTTGTREIAALGGLGRAMPVTALAALLAGASMAGLPPLFGWIGKELLYAGGAAMPLWPLVLPGLVLANALMIAVAARVVLGPFFGPQPAAPTAEPHEAPWTMLAGPLLLAIAGLLAGLLAPWLLQPLMDQAVIGSLQAERSAGLHLWAGFNLPLLLSALTILLGVLIWRRAGVVLARLEPLALRLFGLDPAWDRFMDGFKHFTLELTRRMQTGRLTDYLFASFAVLALMLGGTLLLKLPAIRLSFDAPLMLWLIAGFTLAGAAAAVSSLSRITAIAGVGTVGIGVALVFISFGAPDVATTQLMVETLSAVLFGIACLKLPGITESRSRGRKRTHAVLAVAVGLCMTLIVLAISTHPLDRQITSYYEQGSYYLAHGLNIVNVILVDFRAFDTFGELIVVLLASIGAYALLKRRIGGAKP